MRIFLKQVIGQQLCIWINDMVCNHTITYQLIDIKFCDFSPLNLYFPKKCHAYVQYIKYCYSNAHVSWDVWYDLRYKIRRLTKLSLVPILLHLILWNRIYYFEHLMVVPIQSLKLFVLIIFIVAHIMDLVVRLQINCIYRACTAKPILVCLLIFFHRLSSLVFQTNKRHFSSLFLYSSTSLRTSRGRSCCSYAWTIGVFFLTSSTCYDVIWGCGVFILALSVVCEAISWSSWAVDLFQQILQFAKPLHSPFLQTSLFEIWFHCPQVPCSINKRDSLI